MAQHAKLSASGSAKWLNCAASITAEEGYEDTTSAYAIEGTVAHDLAERCQKDDVHPRKFLGDYVEGVEIDNEMVLAVEDYLLTVSQYHGETYIEERVNYSTWTGEDSFGTADCVKLDYDNSHVTVIDLKYGKGIKVEAFENTQGMLYCLGVLHEFEFMHEWETFRVVIVQPRLDHVSEYDITIKELREFGELVAERAELTRGDNPEATPGEKACQWCKAREDCKPRANWILNQVIQDFDSVGFFEVRDTDKLTPADISRILPFVKTGVSFLKSVEARAHRFIEDGESVPGYKQVEGRSYRKWVDEEEVVKKAKRIRGTKVADLYIPRKLKSPAQLEKIIGKEHIIMKTLVSKPKGKPTLAFEGDPREAIEYNDDPFEGLNSDLGD